MKKAAKINEKLRLYIAFFFDNFCPFFKNEKAAKN
jgi:hypothetical protein